MDTNITTTKLRYDRASPETWRPGRDWKMADAEYMEQCDNHSFKDSDDTPILSYRYEKYRHYVPYSSPRKHTEDRDRRSMGRLLAKLFMFCTAMILFCVFMYIPVYSKVNRQFTRGVVSGWSYHANRDTKLYIKPENVTAIHEPNDVCPKTRDKKIFLLVVVISSTKNFEARRLIRETWGDYQTYKKLSKSFHIVREKYRGYNFTYDLYPNSKEADNKTIEILDKLHIKKTNVVKFRRKRGISGLNQLLPSIAEVLKYKLAENRVNKEIADKTENLEEKRFDDDEDDKMLPEFDMNKELGENKNDGLDYDYDTNVMKIPPRGYEDDPLSVMKIMNLLNNAEFSSNSAKMSDDNNSKDEKVEDIKDEPSFKVVFLLGLPNEKNETDVQNKIDAEVEKYGDIIQEDVIDTYNNLTLKSIMMLKWVINECNDTVRYILKTDDDMFINMPNLMETLQNKSKEFSQTKTPNHSKEYLLIGDLINGAKPVLDTKNKWFSPRYMYAGRVYPKYLSGTGYVFSLDAGRALYEAALHTPYFHLEDIYITGMCAARASPRLWPKDSPGFSYRSRLGSACALYAQVTAHDPLPAAIASLLRTRDVTPDTLALLDMCERIRLTQLRKDRMKSKKQTKKLPLPRRLILRSQI